MLLAQPLAGAQAADLRDSVQHPSANTAARTAVSSQLRASTEVAEVADGGSPLLSFATVGGAGAVAAISAAFVLGDPAKRRAEQTKAAGGNEKAAVQSYFNTQGFERWSKIYSESDEVSKVQKDIRDGHAQTVDKVLALLDSSGGVKGISICDAGCGTGSLAIPLALRGAAVSASDISQAMAGESRSRYEAELAKGAAAPSTAPTFEASDLESLKGQWDTVACLDVLIHYDQNNVDGMIRHLASLADKQLILSFAPKTLYYSALKRVGELFGGKNKATRAYLHAEADIEAALNKAGFDVVHKDLTATSFYFSRLFQAKRKGGR
ncbi:hypothetical protein WJX73_005304 [Symbiochloris irregularis]|uniref:Magnesium-protoporphyrin IX methyltransferase C-terminal domain-containing protein n=1 Tax=Symbiochloris irregularis TaxID=706552 RepID=A0AAW1PQV6_9CHLO